MERLVLVQPEYLWFVMRPALAVDLLLAAWPTLEPVLQVPEYLEPPKRPVLEYSERSMRLALVLVVSAPGLGVSLVLAAAPVLLALPELEVQAEA